MAKLPFVYPRDVAHYRHTPKASRHLVNDLKEQKLLHNMRLDR